MRTLHLICLILAIIGALNWGLIGLFRYDLVAAIFNGPASPAARAVYTIVGLAGLVLIFTTSAIWSDRRAPLSMSPR